MDMAGKIKEITNQNLVLDLFTKLLLIKLTEPVLKGKRGAGLEASLPIFDKIKKELKMSYS